MKKAIEKGYTLTVTSWENDADNYNTKSKTVQTLEEAKVWNNMMELCKSKNNQPKGVIKLGNSYDSFNAKQKEVAKNFIKKNAKILVPQNNIANHENDLADWFCDLAGELLGYGENYACRVMATCSVTHSPEDIYVKEIKF